MKHHYVITALLLAALMLPQAAAAQEVTTEMRQAMGLYLDDIARREVTIGKIKIDSVSTSERNVQLFANINCSYIPFREENVSEIYSGLKQLLPEALQRRDVQLITDGHAIEEFIPNMLRNKPDKKMRTFAPFKKGDKALVRNSSQPYTPTEGLTNRHIAMWQSHGWYYEPKLSRWEWQRARIFQTVEDLYTQSYVLPFLVPMLENAGANVLLPRERDTQRNEVIVDNDGDGTSLYTETGGTKRWEQGSEAGFAHIRATYVDAENPFRDGTYRQVATIKNKKEQESTATWQPDIPEAGRYAVYVSYHTLPESTDDALYTVYHRGGTTTFRVNQQMGGGTWIYLGTFGFDSGRSSCRVTLSNRSEKAGRVVTADAVKIGGGMGNVARHTGDYPYETSGYPRFCEGARYWLQWAGVPDSIYSESKGANDYTDDYRCRGRWVNYLAGGSAAEPDGEGLHIPVDMSLAFHSDAGTTKDDSIIGTLGIFMTRTDDGVYANGASRYLARSLTDLIQSQIVDDVRALYEPMWTRRGMWNQSYYEARVPRVPAMLLELLSHQNFADMRYGLDPRFRFTVSRAIYKGILRFLASQYGTTPTVQPLPVEQMALRLAGDNEVELTWQPVGDPLEPTADADRYVVYTRVGDGDFDNGTVVTTNSYRTTIPAGVVCSFKVTAANKGGESFPSEILSAGSAFNSRGTVLVVNGFDRISAPADFVAPAPADTLLAGFLDELDHGVPYLNDISFIGSQKEFRRSIPWMDDDASGFGDSFGNYENQVIAGNTFDYPALHGAAIMQAGYSFTSCSAKAVDHFGDYKYLDLILGKQCQTKMGRGGVNEVEFKTFPDTLQRALTDYCRGGGNLLVSGAYVGTDLWDNSQAEPQEADKQFATQVLKYKWRAGRAGIEGHVKSVASPSGTFAGNYTYYNRLNATCYAVESPDAIEPAADSAFTVMRYAENNLSAGVAYRGNDYRTVVLGFPFEALQTAAQRDALMQQVLTFFTNQ